MTDSDKMNDKIKREILYFFGFTNDYHLNNKDTGGFFLFPHSIENVERNLQRIISNNLVLTEKSIQEIFEKEKNQIQIQINQPEDYFAEIHYHNHKGCDSNQDLSKILKIYELLEDNAEKEYLNYNVEEDYLKILQKIIKYTKTVKDLLILKVLSLILSENGLYKPSNTKQNITEILKELEIPEALHNKLEEFDKFTKHGEVDFDDFLRSLFSDAPYSFMGFYAHKFNSTGCSRKTYILFHKKIVDYLTNLFDSLSLDRIIIKSFTDLQTKFRSKYGSPLFNYKDDGFKVSNIIIEKWNQSLPVLSIELEDYGEAIEELINKNLLINDDDQILLKEGNQKQSGLKDYVNSKFFSYYNSLKVKEDDRIEFYKNKFTINWLHTKIKIDEDKILIFNKSNDYSSEKITNIEKNKVISDNSNEKNSVSNKINKFDKTSLEIQRGGDWKIEGGKSVFYYKVKVKNNSSFLVAPIQILLTSIPAGLFLQSNNNITIENLKPGAYQSPTFKLIANESCVGDRIDGLVVFTNYRGKSETIFIEPFKIHYVCNLLTPKEVSREYFNEATEFMEEKKKIIDSNLDITILTEKITEKFKECNFSLMKDFKQSQEETFTKFEGFAKGIYDNQDVALTVAVKKIEGGARLVVKAMSDKSEKIVDLLRDFSVKLDDIKSDTELIKEYSPIIEEIFDHTKNIEEFMKESLTSDFEKIKIDFDECRIGKITKIEFMRRGLKILGKNFIKKIVDKFSPFKLEA